MNVKIIILLSSEPLSCFMFRQNENDENSEFIIFCTKYFSVLSVSDCVMFTDLMEFKGRTIVSNKRYLNTLDDYQQLLLIGGRTCQCWIQCGDQCPRSFGLKIVHKFIFPSSGLTRGTNSKPISSVPIDVVRTRFVLISKTVLTTTNRRWPSIIPNEFQRSFGL